MTNPPLLTASERAAARQALLDFAGYLNRQNLSGALEAAQYAHMHYSPPLPRPTLTVRGATYTYHEGQGCPWRMVMVNGSPVSCGSYIMPYARDNDRAVTSTRAELVDAIAVIDATASWKAAGGRDFG